MAPEQKSEATKKRARIVAIVGVAVGLILITVGTITAPKLGNYAMLFTMLGITVAVVAFVSASARVS